MEPNEVLEQATDEKPKTHMGALVAVTVALLATFMGICKVKDDNICQAMQQAQADKIDDWGWYQAKKTRIEIMKESETQIMLAQSMRPEIKTRLAALQKEIKEKKGELDATQAKAKGDEKTYDDLNFRDDQFDLADSALAVSIALLAVSALTERMWLYWLAMVPTGFGVIMGLAGLLALKIHPDLLAKLLGA